MSLLGVEHGFTPVMTKEFNHLIVDELISMPDPIGGKRATANERSLAFRNLLRGYVMGLPSGQKIADALATLGIPVDPNQDLKFSEIKGWDQLDSTTQTKLGEHTPLFLYLMREAGVIGKGKNLGPVGSAILLRTFGSMLLNCRTYLTEEGKLTKEEREKCAYFQPWSPLPELAGCDSLELADIVRFVQR